MGTQTIMYARMILVVANGEAKAQAVHDMCYGPVTPNARLRSCSCTPTALSLLTRPLFRSASNAIKRSYIVSQKALALRGPF